METERPERTAGGELGGGIGMDVAAADKVTINIPERDADPVSLTNLKCHERDSQNEMDLWRLRE